MSNSQPAPYPSDIRAKGWRFELDHERIAQSSTWALAGAEGRPWLLMLWMTAWQQCPCGSLPADDDVIAALMGCAPKVWAKVRKVLLRGWMQADDVRLYHPTITERVLEMVEQRTKTAKRVAEYKVKLREQREGNALPPCEQHDKNGTGTGTGTGTSIKNHTEDPPHPAGGGASPAGDVFDKPAIFDTSGHDPTAAGSVCKAMRLVGIGDVNPGHPMLLGLLEAGASEAEFLGFAKHAASNGKGFAWVLGAVRGERERAAAAKPGLHRGPIPLTGRAAENAQWIAGTSLDRSSRKTITTEAEYVASIALGR